MGIEQKEKTVSKIKKSKKIKFSKSKKIFSKKIKKFKKIKKIFNSKFFLFHYHASQSTTHHPLSPNFL